VSGGTFERSYDAVTATDPTNLATLSPFRLNKYEVTVGRFRPFVAAVSSGWRPADGSGKHDHLNGGHGLSGAGGFEAGWNASAWNGILPATATAWNDALGCFQSTWTPAPGGDEHLPIVCVDWYEAYAFCIWDGGFLPSEAEWDFAAAGGGGSAGQRVYPWSTPSTSQLIDSSHANYDSYTAAQVLEVGAESPAGDGVFGQTDLAGNVWEWNLDSWSSAYVSPCTDCASLPSGQPAVYRGGGYQDFIVSGAFTASARANGSVTDRSPEGGFRCARSP
jgi:formylglycine-generating enzyme required for sulfatase activity